MVDVRTSNIIDAIRRGDQRCGECNHPRFVHFNDKCMATFNNTLILCGCIEFVPLDNLDYVEWLAKKKGLIQ